MKVPLGRKIVLLIVCVAILLIVTCICVSGVVVRKLMEKEYIITADSMAGTAASMTDGDEFVIILRNNNYHNVEKLTYELYMTFSDIEKAGTLRP